jgi:hypothetical protein
MSTFASDTETRIRDLAYALWIGEGRPEGQAEAHWFKALALVNAEAGEAPPAELENPAMPTADKPAIKAAGPAKAAFTKAAAAVRSVAKKTSPAKKPSRKAD